MRFPISYSKPMRILSTVLGLRPGHSAVEIDADSVDVRMGWAFHVTVPRSAITSAQHAAPRRYTRGAHGWNGTYLVNGRGDGLVTIVVDPVQRGVMVGFPVNVSEVTVSVDDPEGFVATLGEREST